MRLIDADALAREIEKIKWNLQMLDDTQSADKVWNGVRMAEKKVEDAPTIDAVPVVRCKDCKWFDKQRCVCHNPRYGDGYANYQPPNTNDEYWCADGERKDDDGQR